ncbi:uncharacterized mitochondrial protein AtMg00810-like [Rutidosis leptorrhynchoides]|uniref:uncharacterized mitochondrial protein AtMg00810-like n=1 Tax=Rutidosis leptorrhynchoides TaxID=125765 RepID=UPI003A99955B
MTSCHPCRTQVEQGAKLTTHDPSIRDPTLYWSLAGALQYLTFTRPYIPYVVQQRCLFMHDPREKHMYALKRIIRYFQAITLYDGHLSGNSHLLTLVPKRNIVELQMLLLRLAGIVIFFKSSIVLSPLLHWYIVIIVAQSASLLIQFSISGPSTSRYTFTLSVT